MPTPGGSSSCACRPRRRTSAPAPTSPTSPARTTRASPGPCSARTGRPIARRLVGSQFDDPVALQAAEGSEAPRVAINGRGVGYAGVAGTTSAGAYGAVLKDDLFNPGVLLGGGFAAPAPVPAVAETGDGLIAFQQGDAERRALDHRAPLRLRARVASSSRSPGPRRALRPGARADRRLARARGRGRPRRRRRDRLRPGRRRRAPDRGGQPRPRARAPSGPTRRPSGASSRARR